MARAGQVDVLMAGFTNDSGQPLGSGKVYCYEAGTTNLKDTYRSASSGEAETNPIILDAAGRALVFGNGGYKFVITDENDVTIVTYDDLYYGEYTDSSVVAYWGGYSTGDADEIDVSVGGVSELVSGDTIKFVAHIANNASADIVVNGGTPIPIFVGGSAVGAGAILINGLTVVVYDGINFLLTDSSTISGSDIQAGSITETQLASLCNSLSKMQADSVGSDQYVDGSILTAHIGDTQITSDHLNADVAGNGIGGAEGGSLYCKVDNDTMKVYDDKVQIKEVPESLISLGATKWTPVASYTSGGTALTIDSHNCSYVDLGDYIFVSMYIRLDIQALETEENLYVTKPSELGTFGGIANGMLYTTPLSSDWYNCAITAQTESSTEFLIKPISKDSRYFVAGDKLKLSGLFVKD